MSNVNKEINNGTMPEKEIDNGTAPLVTKDPDESLNNMSKKDVFGWETIGNIRIPCIMRGDEHYLCVRMVEKKLLSKYPNKYPDEISNRPPLLSEFITTTEATLLNEINRDHCQHGFGQDLFTTDDVVVKVQEFKDFFTIVQKLFGNISQQLEPGQTPSHLEPGEVVGKKTTARPATGGWLQVNDTVIPFVYRGQTELMFVPLAVVKYAAGLLTETTLDGFDLYEDECIFLTNICTEAGLTFHFTQTMKALPIGIVCLMCKNVVVKHLPKGDPFKHAEHSEDKVVESAVNSLPELAIPQSVLPATHAPPGTGTPPIPIMVLPCTGVLPTNTNYQQNVDVNGQHSPIDSLMAHTAQQVSIQNQTIQPTVHPFNPTQADAMMGAATKPAAHKSHTQTLTSQAPPPQKHLEKIQELHNRYLPQVRLPPPQIQHLSPQQLIQMQSQRLNQISPVGVPTHCANGKPEACKIEPVQLLGKTVSYISKKGLKYTLIEALCKVFFPGVVLQEFEYAIKNLLKVPIHRLSEEEECAFLKFYELPPIAGGLICKSLIYIAHFKNIFPRLKMIFVETPELQERPKDALKRQIPDFNPLVFNPQTMNHKLRKMDDTVKRLLKYRALE